MWEKHLSDGTEFSWRVLIRQMIHGYWGIQWDTRKPVPMFAGAVHVYHDGHWFAVRVWRVTITIDPYLDRRPT
jgi:hypothetical protein